MEVFEDQPLQVSSKELLISDVPAEDVADTGKEPEEVMVEEKPSEKVLEEEPQHINVVHAERIITIENVYEFDEGVPQNQERANEKIDSKSVDKYETGRIQKINMDNEELKAKQDGNVSQISRPNRPNSFNYGGMSLDTMELTHPVDGTPGDHAISPGEAWLNSLISPQLSEPSASTLPSTLHEQSEVDSQVSVTSSSTSDTTNATWLQTGFEWQASRDSTSHRPNDAPQSDRNSFVVESSMAEAVDTSDIVLSEKATNIEIIPNNTSTESGKVNKTVNFSLKSEHPTTNGDSFPDSSHFPSADFGRAKGMTIDEELPQDITLYEDMVREDNVRRSQDESVLSSDSDWSVLGGQDDRPLIVSGSGRGAAFNKIHQVHANRAVKEGSPVSNASASDDDTLTRKPLLVEKVKPSSDSRLLQSQRDTTTPERYINDFSSQYSKENKGYRPDSFESVSEDSHNDPMQDSRPPAIRLNAGQPVEPHIILMPPQEMVLVGQSPEHPGRTVSPTDVRLDIQPRPEEGAVGGVPDLETSYAEDVVKNLPEDAAAAHSGPVTVPYVRRLTGFKAGRAILVDGVIEKPAKGFSLGLQSTEHIPPRTEIPLLLDVDMTNKEVSANTYISESWSIPMTSDIKPFPFEAGKRFSIKIVVEAYHYKIYVNNVHVMDYEFRLPFNKAIFMRLDGDATFFNIECPHVLELPYTLEHPQGLRSGSSITLDSYIWRKASSIDMTVLSAEKTAGKKPSSFTTKVLFEGSGGTRVEMRSVHAGHAAEEGLVEGHLEDIQPGREVKFKFTFEHGKVVVELNDEHFTEYEHKLPLHKMATTTVDGDLSLYNLKVERPTRRRSSVKKLSRGIKNSCCPCCGSDGSCTVL